MTDRCRSTGKDQPRLLPTHLAGCDTPGCAGCVACPEAHCGTCGYRHTTVDGRGTDLTCATCIHETRTAIGRLRDLTRLMTAAATERGINSLAALHAGPAADYEAWSHHHRSVVAGRLCRCRTARNQTCPATLPQPAGPTCEKRCQHDSCHRIHGLLCPDVIAWHRDCRDELHPAWVLGSWDFMVRHHLGHTLDLVHLDDGSTVEQTITLDHAADYLNSHLTRLAHDPDFDFAQLHAEITGCATHLDEVLGVADFIETGAGCPECHRANLEKSYGDTPADDRWTCPRCAAWWTDDTYRAKVEATYVEHAPALTASQIAATYRVAESTVRTWATRGLVRKHGKDRHGRQTYDVDDVRLQRDRNSESA